jgi:hypothetical protein
VNGRVQRIISGTQLRDMNLLNGTQFDCTGLPNTAPGVSIPLFLAEPWLTDEPSQDALAWKTNLWDTFQIDVDLAAAATPTLVIYAVTDTLQAAKPEGIVKWLRPQTGAQGTSFDLLGIQAKDYVRQISLYPDSERRHDLHWRRRRRLKMHSGRFGIAGPTIQDRTSPGRAKEDSRAWSGPPTRFSQARLRCPRQSHFLKLWHHGLEQNSLVKL